MNIKKALPILSAVCLIAAAAAAGAHLLKKDKNSALPAAEALSSLSEHRFGEYENLHFDCTVHNTDIETVFSEIEISPYSQQSDSSFYAELKTKAADFIYDLSGDTVSLTEFDDTAVTAEGDYDHCIYDGGGLYLDYYSDGTFVYNDLRALGAPSDGTMPEQPAILEKLKGTDDLSGVVYSIGGEEYSLIDAVSFAQGYIKNRLLKYLCPGDEPVLSDIAVVRSAEYFGNAYVLRFRHTFDGVYVDDSFFSSLDGDHIRGSYLQITICSPDRAAMVHNMYYYTVLDTKIADTLIPLSEAEELLSQALAPYTAYTVTECELEYVCITSQGAERVLFRPMWVFVIDEESCEDYLPFDDYFNKTKTFIDACTGEHYMFMPDKGLVR